MTPNLSLLVKVRDYKPEDKAFVVATFLRGLYYGDFYFGLIPKPVFMENYAKFFEALLASPNTVVMIACDKEDEDLIRGYSVLSSDLSTIHWVYVKSGWRRQGIARMLTPQRPDAVTHLTKLGVSLLPKIPTAIFNPFKV